MGDHQAQASGLEFKFQKAALKHFNYHLQLKKRRKILPRKEKQVLKKEPLKFAMTETSNSKRRFYPLTHLITKSLELTCRARVQVHELIPVYKQSCFFTLIFFLECCKPPFFNFEDTGKVTNVAFKS